MHWEIFCKSQLELVKDKAMILYFQNPDYIEQLLEERRIRIKHERLKESFVLTASTEELQKFVLKYMDDKQAFVESDVLLRKKKVPQDIRKYFPRKRVSEVQDTTGNGVFWSMDFKNEGKPLRGELKNLSEKSEMKMNFKFNPAKDTLVYHWGMKDPPEDPEEIKEIISIEIYSKSDRQRVYLRAFLLDSQTLEIAMQDVWQQLPEGHKQKKVTFELVPKGVNRHGDTLRWNQGKIEFIFDHDNQ